MMGQGFGFIKGQVVAANGFFRYTLFGQRSGKCQ
jgi:hypothetical protein